MFTFDRLFFVLYICILYSTVTVATGSNCGKQKVKEEGIYYLLFVRSNINKLEPKLSTTRFSNIFIHCGQRKMDFSGRICMLLTA